MDLLIGEYQMQLEHVARHLRRREREWGLEYSLGAPAPESAIQQAQRRLGVALPTQVERFYRYYDGLSAADPPLEVFPLERLAFVHRDRLRFAVVDGRHDLCFDVSGVNEAGQWDIVVAATGYRVTMTMASFWSNKLWAWIDQRRAIWMPEPGDWDYVPPAPYPRLSG
ncbi:MAG: SMI1/KNR4 family protein [Chloroflexota bacterium]|nr:SMI1/KNR4 family protein [Chloroflexota bacterium]